MELGLGGRRELVACAQQHSLTAEVSADPLLGLTEG